MADGKDGECLGIVRVEGNCPREQHLRRGIVAGGHPPKMRQRPHHQAPSVETPGRLALGVKVFCRIELWLDRGDDRLGDLVLYCEHVG